MKQLMKWLKNEESGQGMVEYGLILAGIALVALIVVGILSGKLQGIFNGISLTLGDVSNAVN